jgi:hypothetical protein
MIAHLIGVATLLLAADGRPERKASIAPARDKVYNETVTI